MIEEHIGKTFGEYTITGPAEEKPDPRRARCRCSCGEIREILFTDLKTGRRISCGHNHPWRQGPHAATANAQKKWRETQRPVGEIKAQRKGKEKEAGNGLV